MEDMDKMEVIVEKYAGYESATDQNGNKYLKESNYYFWRFNETNVENICCLVKCLTNDASTSDSAKEWLIANAGKEGMFEFNGGCIQMLKSSDVCCI